MSIGIGYGNGIMLGCFQPVPTGSYVELFHLDCTNHFLVFKTSSKVVLVIFISVLATRYRSGKSQS